MATQAQINANRANSEKSTGPTTEEGKNNSCLNRLSHGFASSVRFIKGEDREEFKALMTDLIDEHQPATPTEQILLERMAHNQWLGLRAIRIQGDELARMRFFNDVQHNLALLIRYQTTADRAFYKAYNELLKAQKQRRDSNIGFESKKAAETDRVAAEAPPESAQKPPAPPAKPPQNDLPTPAGPDFTSIEPELEWVMNAGTEEMRASGI